MNSQHTSAILFLSHATVIVRMVYVHVMIVMILPKNTPPPPAAIERRQEVEALQTMTWAVQGTNMYMTLKTVAEKTSVRMFRI